MNGRAPLVIACFVVGVLAAVLLPTIMATRDASNAGSPAATPRAAGPAIGVTPPAGIARVDLDSLPAEAAMTVALIESGGPFPFRQDGATFENREGLLPQRPRGHYREYTVAVANDQGRGPLRIVTGADGEWYWSADHYASFAWIVR
ncbi:MAG TPA: ribonuclease domain-containing protein [Methylomirabilota bacterium]|nr:ribonuclease domain-containing protein [Methylomirabilota bacterium]